jgi:hypothetical protein
MLVYLSETPCAVKGIMKTQLLVFWHSNKKAWVMQTIFSDWYMSYFCPAVKEFCTKNRVPHKVLLLLDNAPGHPPDLSDLNTNGLEVKIVFLPPNTTSLLQLK